MIRGQSFIIERSYWKFILGCIVQLIYILTFINSWNLIYTMHFYQVTLYRYCYLIYHMYTWSVWTFIGLTCQIVYPDLMHVQNIYIYILVLSMEWKGNIRFKILVSAFHFWCTISVLKRNRSQGSSCDWE